MRRVVESRIAVTGVVVPGVAVVLVAVILLAIVLLAIVLLAIVLLAVAWLALVLLAGRLVAALAQAGVRIARLLVGGGRVARTADLTLAALLPGLLVAGIALGAAGVVTAGCVTVVAAGLVGPRPAGVTTVRLGGPRGLMETGSFKGRRGLVAVTSVRGRTVSGGAVRGLLVSRDGIPRIRVQVAGTIGAGVIAAGVAVVRFGEEGRAVKVEAGRAVVDGRTRQRAGGMRRVRKVILRGVPTRHVVPGRQVISRESATVALSERMPTVA